MSNFTKFSLLIKYAKQKFEMVNAIMFLQVNDIAHALVAKALAL